MRLHAALVLASLNLAASAQTITATGADYPTSGITYAGDGSTIALADNGTMSDGSSATAARNGTASRSPSQTLLVGSAHSSTSLNGTASSTSSSAPRPTNTVPCNGHVEFCQRKFSNITYVAAHNSPFIRPGNLATNQLLDVEAQLNDGIRMLQFQTHFVNDTLYLCHTSCDLLNAGSLEDYLTTVAQWLQANPYDVVTILMGNSDLVDPHNYTAPVVDSGLIDLVYTPPTAPMPLRSWPTLAEMIFAGKRAVVMLDYKANQTAIPWLLDEFSQMWETPFSPTERDFPCTEQRPPDQPRNVSTGRMYMANHNLNLDLNVGGLSLLVPFVSLINETNAVTGFGSAGAAVENCTAMWGRPPNFLLVDFYNLGSFNGSVFQAAADANNVTYNRDSCCDTDGRPNGATALLGHTQLWILFTLVVAGVLW